MTNNHYQKLITPQKYLIKEISNSIGISKSRNRMRIIKKVINKINKRFKFDDTSTGSKSLRSLIKDKRGNCLMLGTLVCSILRNQGFSEDEVFVVIAASRDFICENAHAWILIKIDEKTILVDPRDMRVNNKKILDNLTVFLVFNDKHFYITKEQKNLIVKC